VHLCRGQGHVHNTDDLAFGERAEGDGALLQVPAGGAHGNSIAWMGKVENKKWTDSKVVL
jgi:hypothetical protein